MGEGREGETILLNLMLLLGGQCPEERVGEDEGGGHAPAEDGEGDDDAALRDESLDEDEEQVHPWGGKEGVNEKACGGLNI